MALATVLASQTLVSILKDYSRGSLPLILSGEPGIRGWTAQRHRIEPNMNIKKKKKEKMKKRKRKVNEMIPIDILLYF